MKCELDFISYWAVIAHVLSLLGVLPSTLALGLFILGGSIYVENFVSTSGHNMVFDLLLHFLPVAVLLYYKLEIVIWPIFALFALYLAWMNFDFNRILHIYNTKNRQCFEEEAAKRNM